MNPIYLPTHQLDASLLAKWSFGKSIRSILLIAGGWGLAIGLLAQIQLDMPQGAGILIGVAMAILLVVALRFRAKAIYLERHRSQLLVPRTLMLDDKGFRLDYKNAVSLTVPWAAVLGASWSPDFLIIVTTLGDPTFIPRSVLTPDALALIRERITNSNALAVPPNAW